MEIRTFRGLSSRHRRGINTVIVGVCLMAGLFSCTRINQYHEYHPVQKAGWYADSMLVFQYEATDTLQEYSIELNIRHQSEYPYQNLWIFSSLTDKDSVSIKDSINLFLADDQGRWQGSGLGIVYHYSKIIYPAFRFSKKGKYNFELKHGMRDSILTGIREAGLKITPIQHGQK